MEARNKTIEQWFSMIDQAQILLPRFQRHEAWRNSQIVGLLENILRKPSLPVGALLILEVGDKEPFHSRPIVGAPPRSGKPLMHLLDGQQRMTALWRSLTGDYDDLTIFVSLDKAPPPADLDEGEEAPDLPGIEIQKRWHHKGERRPLWADDPSQVFARGLIPISCLRPGSRGEKALEEWLGAVRSADKDPNPRLGRIYELRQRVQGYMIPFLSLPVGTGRETALDVFIKMNTSASPLTDYDIVVAQLEEATGESLHDKVEELLEQTPFAARFGSVEDHILSVSALLAGKPALKKTYLAKDFGADVARVWPQVKTGFERGIRFLQEEGIYGEKTLPTEVAVYLTCALWAGVPVEGFDAEGKARSLIRKALWRGCYTDRYGKTATTRAFADYKALSALIAGGKDAPACELFDDKLYPLPAIEELAAAGWPGRKDRLPRALLATSLRAGGVDFADGAAASLDNVGRREYHHIFPVDLLGGDRGEGIADRALNCALVTWRTNRKIAAMSPADYIVQRAEAAHLGVEEVRHRLSTHLIPYDALIGGDYEAFLMQRAKLMWPHIEALCSGAAHPKRLTEAAR